jgi:hypothetical protein
MGCRPPAAGVVEQHLDGIGFAATSGHHQRRITVPQQDDGHFYVRVEAGFRMWYRFISA